MAILTGHRSNIWRVAMAAGALTTALILAGCGTIPQAGGAAAPGSAAPTGSGSDTGGGPDTSQAATPASTPTPPPARFSSNVANGAKGVKVSTVVTVRANPGTISKVKLTYTGKDSRGRTVSGSVPGKRSADKLSWVAGGRLEPNSTYTLTTVGKGPTGAATTTTTKFKTQNLTLKQQTFAQLQPLKGSVVGVGMPVILLFDVPVKNKKEFEKHLTVTSSPKQAGSWSWLSDREVHYRPKKYWKPGTKVVVVADLNGLPAGNGVYGQNSTSTSFKVGRSMITKINLSSKQAKVYIGGSLARTIPISAGKKGWQTRSGTKVVLEKLPVTRMTNEMIGAKENYDLKVKYAMRITWSGEFMHAAPWNAGKFGVVNASHGCVGMSTANAQWLFNRIQVGDPVVTTGSSRGLEKGNGYTDWNVSYAQYKQGSAI